MKPPRRILIREPNWVGDNIFTLPAVLELRRRFPEASLAVLTRPGIAPFWELVPGVEEIIPFPFRGGLRDLRGKLSLARRLRRREFDLAVVFPRSFESAFWIFLSGVPERWGYREEGRSLLLTRGARAPGGYRHTHRIDYYYRLLPGTDPDSPAPLACLELAAGLRLDARARLEREFGSVRGGPLIGLHPRASHGPAKCWPLEHFGRLARRLGEELGARVLLFGTPVESELNARVAASGGGRTRDMTGKTGLKELAGLLALCDVAVGNDTGPIHLAAAMGTPVVALFGSSDPEATAPRGRKVRVIYRNLPCSPCLRQVCPRDTACLADISPGEVFDHVRELLDRTRVPGSEKPVIRNQ